MKESISLLVCIVIGISLCIGFAMMFDTEFAREVGDLVTGWLE